MSTDEELREGESTAAVTGVDKDGCVRRRDGLGAPLRFVEEAESMLRVCIIRPMDFIL